MKIHNKRSQRLPLLLILLLFLPSISLLAQSQNPLVDAYLRTYVDQSSLDLTDIDDYTISDQFQSQHNGLTHIHIRQRYQGIEVYNGTANFAIRNGAVVYMANRLEAQLAQRAKDTEPSLSPEQAIAAAARDLLQAVPGDLQLIEKLGAREYLYTRGGISQVNIPVKLMYLPGPEGELFLVWDLSLYTLDGKHWWSVRVDAQNGQLRDQTDWVVSCDWPDHDHRNHDHDLLSEVFPSPLGALGTNSSTSPQYRVIPYYTESPNHGPDTLLVDPADSIASPYGWHDIDGQAGYEYTITRGNNVYASEDRNDDNVPGYSPDGDTTLNFDFPFNLNQAPVNYQDAAITNLFYLNNIMHDIWYHYGFDEQAGNFQQNNYGRGGTGGDYVRADAQDGGGTNNANFATPPDGNNPRMQMYLWTSGSGLVQLLTVNSPSSIQGGYSTSQATFGPGVPATPLTADLVLVDDGTNPDPEDACDPIVNAAALNGKIAVIDRGNCTFVAKVEAAQNAGAVAVIIVNNSGGGLISMGGASNTITIPSVMISLADGIQIKNRLLAGDTVNATLQNSTGSFDRDGDFDNGIIAHEYGHGISIRMTGGPSTSGCLSNAEQMGEGWSDWFGLMLSLDTAVVNRGIGTFAINQTPSGGGIRNAPYSPDFSVNPFTYGATNSTGQISEPHGIGFVWCTMLWDLNLALIDQYGFDPDLYHGTGGNNMAMQLVMDGIKLQPCSPGFVDGRDAILQADQLLYGGANQCLIWEVFAKRGLGLSASQGSSQSRTDQVEAFDLPTICLTPTAAPLAAYSFSYGNGCMDRVYFQDQSTSTPQQWRWDFGDGNTDSIPNPVHTYANSGTYTVTLVVENALGGDTLVQTVQVNLPPGPFVSNTEICAGEAAQLSINGTNLYNWYDQNDNLLQTGPNFTTPVLQADTTFYADQAIPAPIQKIGPLDGSFSTGGYHNTGFTGTLNFTAEDEFTLVSVWLDAGSAGPRTITLWDGIDGEGNVVDQVTINIPAGPQRVNLDLFVPGPGTYSVGGTSIDLFRNNGGANYPYEIQGLVSINGSSATTDPSGFYYYLYDWEVRGRSCRGERVPIELKVSKADFAFTQDNTGTQLTFNDLSTGAKDWLWDFGDGDSSTQQNPVHAFLSQDTFVVKLLVNGACSHEDTVVIAYNTSLENWLPGTSLQLYPNPAREQLWLQFSQSLTEGVDLTLYSINGQALSQRRLEKGRDRMDWDVSQLSPGVYLIKLKNERGVHTVRFVVE
jgi:PKD repeat protein